MKTDAIRKKFLDFFKDKDHKVLSSAPLVPENDPTLLFTGAGMNPFKEFYLGKTKPPAPRIATSQKCLRTVDMEKVGRTSGHHTFFEMLGNFAFGDYFKKETIEWAWGFLRKELKIPMERMSVSVYEDDDESFDIWHKTIGLPKERIKKLGAEDNFWPANAPTEGPNGPCGPCSEIYYDFGKDQGCGLPSCNVDCDCNRFVEVWNLVFTQYDRKEDGTLAPLPQKNIDTGMGLERLASVMQDVTSNFEIDIFITLIREISKILKVDYSPATEEGARIKRIADHIRTLVFTSVERLLPSNEGRGYVVRRILRRAARDGMTLGMKKPFLYKLVPVVIDIMKKAYPELSDAHQHISRIVKSEEEKFLSTVDQGMELLDETISKLSPDDKKIFPGQEAFKLYDTYGFPIDLTEAILREKGFKLDIAGYEEAMKDQRVRSRAFSQMAQEIFSETPITEVKNFLKETEFIGHDKLKSPVKVEAILVEGKLFPQAEKGTEVSVITDKTPFYGESGGQVGDTGVLKSDTCEVTIKDTQHIEDYIIHIGKIRKGILKRNDVMQAIVDEERRDDIARNHTATHILQSVLRSVLGKHVEQSGSLVAQDRLRFDFTHFNALTKDELRVIEDKVNEYILANHSVRAHQLSLEEAKKKGALSFFGEKYGETVRMIEMGKVSKELCGGTHNSKTGEIGSFKIISEASIASGTRRIEAVTGKGALKLVRQQEEALEKVTDLLEAPASKIESKTKAVLKEVKTLRQELAKYTKQDNKDLTKTIMSKATEINGVRVIAELLKDKSMNDLRSMGDILRKSSESLVGLLCAEQNKRANMVVVLSKNMAEKGLDAVAMIKEVSQLIGGSGGGRKDFAQAGGKDIKKIKEVKDKFIENIKPKLQQLQ